MSMPVPRAAAALSLLFAISLASAQQQPASPAATPTPTTAANVPTAIATGRPLFELQVAGPAHWRTLFTPTNVGSLLVSDSALGLRQQIVAPIETAVRQLLGMDDAAYAGARARLLDYAGELDLEVFVADGSELPTVRVRLLPDGSTDLKALGDDFARLASKLTAHAWEQFGADGTGRALDLQGGMVAAAPQLLGDCLATVFAPRDRLAAELAAFAAANPPAAELSPLRPALHLRLDDAAAAARLLREAANADAAAWRAAGLSSLRDFDLELGTAGPMVRLDLAQRFAPADRGIFSVLFPATQGIPGIAALRGDQPAWRAGRFDLGALAKVLAAIAKASGKEPPAADSDEAVFMDPEKSILNHFGDECTMTLSTERELDVGLRATTFCIAFRVRDAAAFLQQVEAARKSIGVTELGNEDLGDGWRLYRFGGFFFSGVVLQGPDLLALGFGRDAKEQLDALAKTARSGTWHQAFVAPEDWKNTLRHAPPGLNGIAEGQVNVLALPVLGALSMLSSMAAGMPHLNLDSDIDGDGEAIGRLLTEHHLDRARSMTGYADDRWLLRTLW